MQIKELVLYGKNGQKRTLPFQLGRVNIIPGKSKTGKSAVGDIIDYCLGGSKCDIAEGIVRETVDWYGLLLQFSDKRIFVARKNPDTDQQTSSACYYEIGRDIYSPANADFTSNTNVEGIENLLTNENGISENIHIPDVGASRSSLEANIRHALFYCFQSQGELSSKVHLFHRQNETFITNAIRDTLPYFLGAVSEDAISLITERRKINRELRILERQLSEADDISTEGVKKAISLLSEAENVGLINNIESIDKKNFGILYNTLANINFQPVNIPAISQDRLSSLQVKLEQKEKELNEINASINEAKTYLGDASNYSGELGHQKVRLESIGLFEKLDFNTARCPFCSGILEIEPPGIIKLKETLQALDQSINRVEKERPQLRRFIDLQENNITVIKTEIINLKAEIDGIYAQINNTKEIRDLNDRRATVFGRISFWIENIQKIPDINENEIRIKNIENRIAEIDEFFSNSSIKERMISILSIIQNDMTRWASELEMEYAGSPYRLDMGRVTAVVDQDRPIPLREMGSASNWLGVHLITIFSLHKYFINHNRPVPRFIFMDQPSQVYFPDNSC